MDPTSLCGISTEDFNFSTRLFVSLRRFLYLGRMREVAVGIILKNGLVLACQRKHNAKYALKWEFPGGKLEAGELPEDALLRELREELAIEATIQKEFFRQEWMYSEGTDNPQRDGSFRVFYFIVAEFSGEPVNNAFERIEWKYPGELQTMDILEGNREAVDRLVAYAQEQQAT
jgi:mutator protein MutT